MLNSIQNPGCPVWVNVPSRVSIDSHPPFIVERGPISNIQRPNNLDEHFPSHRHAAEELQGEVLLLRPADQHCSPLQGQDKDSSKEKEKGQKMLEAQYRR